MEDRGRIKTRIIAASNNASDIGMRGVNAQSPPTLNIITSNMISKSRSTQKIANIAKYFLFFDI